MEDSGSDAGMDDAEGGEELAGEALLARLNSGQRAAAEAFRAVLDDSESPQALMHIDGGPGTGKSFLAAALRHLAHLHTVGTFTTAFTGLAAAPHRGGTLNSTFNIPISGVLRPLSLSEKAEKVNLYLRMAKDAAHAAHVDPAVAEQFEVAPRRMLLIVEEISQVSGPLIKHVDARCKEIMGNSEEAFGGLHVLWLGDYFQQQPPGAVSIYELQVRVVLERTARLMTADQRYVGLLAARFRRYALTEQMRAPEDPAHVAMVEAMRQTDVDHPFTAAHLRQIQVLKPRHAAEDPSWRFAIVAVTSNDERSIIGKAQILQFAVATGEPVFTWLTPLRIGNQEFEGPPFTLTRQLAEPHLYPQMRVYFVRGFPAMLVAENLNMGRGLVNGTRGLLHSFTMAAPVAPERPGRRRRRGRSAEEAEEVKEQEAEEQEWFLGPDDQGFGGRAAPQPQEDQQQQQPAFALPEQWEPGEVIELPHAPAYVNVLVRRDGRDVVVPLKAKAVEICKKNRSRPAMSVLGHNFTLAMCLTYHKV